MYIGHHGACWNWIFVCAVHFLFPIILELHSAHYIHFYLQLTCYNTVGNFRCRPRKQVADGISCIVAEEISHFRITYFSVIFQVSGLSSMLSFHNVLLDINNMDWAIAMLAVKTHMSFAYL